MKLLTKLLALSFIIVLSFGYGMMSQAWDVFPKKQVDKMYWELYAKHAKPSKNDNRFEIQNNWKTIRTSLYTLSVERINLPYDSYTEKTYGGIDDLGLGVLIASNMGDLFYLDRTQQLHELPVSIPFSREKFDEIARSRDLDRHYFGVKDILVRKKSSSTFQVFTSSLHWDSEEQCHTLQFETVVLQQKGTSDFAIREDWDKIYETHPCLPIRGEGSEGFQGLQAGGRIQARSDTELLLTVGDYKRDGLNGEKQIITDTTTSYGKILAFDLDTNEPSVVSTGNRNPQGLYIDPGGRIWSTEHGPEGGDELNLIESGENYGWPHVTYGTEYGMHKWPPSDTIGAHPGYKRPTYAWVPSIAVSEMTGVEGNVFSKWRGDLLITSLKGQTLYRTRIHEGRVIYVEPIKLGSRLRDIIEMKDGTILIKADDGALLTLRPEGRDQT